MSLTTEQIKLIQDSFAQVAPIAPQAAEMFYGRLWEIAPETKPLFKEADMGVQGNKLMQMLGVAVASLNDLETLVPAVKDLGKRHVGYNVTDEHYQPVGEALIWTLEQGLGEAFTDEVREAWVAAYTILADTAIAGAQDATE